MKTQSKTKVDKKINIMRKIKIEKVVLSIGATGEALDRGEKLLQRLTERKPVRRTSRKRIPSLGVRPGLQVGVMVTLRGEEAIAILKRLLDSVDSIIKRKQLTENSFTFGIKEYIEIPGMQYQRDIGIIGLDVSVTFVRAGKRVERKKLKSGKLPKRQHVSEEEIADYIQENLGVKFKENFR